MSQLLPRRAVLVAALTGPLHARGAAQADPASALRRGGVVAAFRHAEAPGIYDPPNMVLGDCNTQRNLDEAGRAQARRLGAWFTARKLRPTRVLSSPWCRCLDTARLAFAQAEAWDALASPAQTSSDARKAQVQTLLQALRAVPAGGFEVWVTHNFVIADLTGISTASAEGLVVQGGEQLAQVLAPAATIVRLQPVAPSLVKTGPVAPAAPRPPQGRVPWRR